MRKTRFVNAIDYGKVRPDGKYGESAIDAPGLIPSESAFKSEHLAKCASTPYRLYAVPVFVQQNEVFESSEYKKPRFNNCKHTKLKTVCYPFSVASQYSSNRNYRYWARRIRSTSHSAPPTARIDWQQVSSNMQAEAYHTMVPRFEGEISMINFLFEMKDFRSISLAACKNIPRILGSPKLTESMNLATKRVAEAHLLKSFAIDPLINDTADIIKQAQTLVMIEQEKFREKGLLPNPRYFSEPLNQSQSLTYLAATMEHALYSGMKTEQTFTATMEGDYGYRCRGDLEAFARYWGLQPTAEAVWNAIPFSFLTDYFISIGDSLNRMRHDKNVQYTVRQYCESILSTAQSGWFIGPRYAGNLLIFAIDDNFIKSVKDTAKTFFVTGTTSSYYERVIKQPYWGPYLPKWKIPSGKQFTNMAALLRCLL